MPVKPPMDDPTAEVLKLRNKLEIKSAEPEMDEKELAEREEAAQAYAGEDENHFVRWMEDCVDTSVKTMKDIRDQQYECYDVYLEKEPPGFAFKEAWQSKVVIPKPYAYVQTFLAMVRKAFDPQFLSIENEQDQDAADFIQKLMTLVLSRTQSNFPINFTDATGMGTAVGQSMEMIPQWRPGRGLEWDLIEPWKIHRDPDSLSRRPQSGMYWIHQEWLDYYDLKQQEKDGILRNIPNCGPGSNWGNPKDDSGLTQEELKRRRGMIYEQSAFRSKVLTREFWGTIVDKRGELLMPKATFTVVGDRVARIPKTSQYPSLRWPGTGFSPLPDLLRYDGRPLIQGIKSLWYAMCSMLALHVDNLNWIVNPPSEIDITSLVDQDDIDDYPGKQYLTHGTAHGEQAVRTVDRKSNVGDVLAQQNWFDQTFQNGGMVSYALQGLPGFRAEVTARESAQNLEQSTTIVGLMGENLEDGALYAIQAAYETVRINITYKELATWMGQEVADKYADQSAPTGLKLPDLTSGSFKVSGVSTLLRNQEVVNSIATLVLPLLDQGKYGNLFAPYIKNYRLLKSIERRLNLQDEGIVVTEDDAKRIDDAQQRQQEQAIEMQGQQQAGEAAQAHAEAAHAHGEAEKSMGEAAANTAQAGLFEAQAGAVQPPEAPGYGGEVQGGVQ